MLFKEAGSQAHPTIILLHGGGLSHWSLRDIVEGLKSHYHVVTPIIEGHGEHGGQTFVSIEQSAGQLLHYIQSRYGGRVHMLGGLSIGAQIAAEALSQKEDIADFAVLESALVLPMGAVSALAAPTYGLFYGLIRMKWFSRLQAGTLFVADSMFEQYYQDSLRMSKQSLINITVSNGNYTLKSGINNTKARTLIIVGEKELGIMKKSARQLNLAVPNSTLYVSPKMGHGQLSLAYPQKYVELVTAFMS